MIPYSRIPSRVGVKFPRKSSGGGGGGGGKFPVPRNLPHLENSL